ncbi:V-type ATP synthase subunit A [Candidatus Micrarchaeota archaeon]|nr:V-type ATP synthase subunit A [Candidatus Micrarchaeota archaeon]
MADSAYLSKIAGPVVEATSIRGSQINELVRVGSDQLMGEIVALKEDRATIQVYEDTSGLRPGEKVERTEQPLSVELGPGLLSGIFDGIQRPLDRIKEMAGDYIPRGIDVPALNRKKKWTFKASVKKGDSVKAGDVLGTVKEFDFEHRILVPYGFEGAVSDVRDGEFTVTQSIASVGKKDVTMMQKWGVRTPRKSKEKLRIDRPLITGKRIVDTFFPIAKGGVAAIPGPFGSGKTVTQQDLAKYADADLIVYVGCGERGNEMTDVLFEFPKLLDPKNKKPLMNRTVLIANTSNMPVAAREASIYTGITIAEYYRDMGYDVALMADSTSRWAEAMREISGRMEEMPGEEGYPAYLAKRLAEFYERAGRVRCLGTKDRFGSVSVIGAVSPPGGDISEPVSQSTLRVTKVFWALDADLSRRRHYPAIHWLKSYSLYLDDLEKWYLENVASDFYQIRGQCMALLQKEAELQNIVQLIGPDALPDKERLVLEVTKMIREDFLQQNSFEEIDVYSSLKKQHLMLKTILKFYDKAEQALKMDVTLDRVLLAKERQVIAGLKRLKDEETVKAANGAMKSLETSFGKGEKK